MSELMSLQTKDGEIYQCQTCHLWFEVVAEIACAVAHPRGACCHVGDQGVLPEDPRPPEQYADIIEAHAALWALLVREYGSPEGVAEAASLHVWPPNDRSAAAVARLVKAAT